MAASATTELNEAEVETEWTDDQIRWHEEFQKIKEDQEQAGGGGVNRPKIQLGQNENEDENEEEEEEEECAYWDPFKDPDPFETFSFQFTTPLPPEENQNSSVENHHENKTTETTTTTTMGTTTISVELRGYKTGADEVWKSTGVTIWRAASYLGRFLASRPRYILPPPPPPPPQEEQEQQPDTRSDDNQQQIRQNNHKILELGAGLGLCGILTYRLLLLRRRQQQQEGKIAGTTSGDDGNDGITVAASSSTSTVCITDGDTDALKYLRDNIEQNKDDTTTTTKVQVSGHQLIWGEETSRTFQKRHGTFDVILASDIIYAKCIVKPLWETIQTLLKKQQQSTTTTSVSPPPPPRFIMAYCARRQVDVTIDYVLDYAIGAGFEYTEISQKEKEEEESQQQGGGEEEDEGVRVFAFEWKKKPNVP